MYDKKGEVFTPPKQSAQQRAIWMMTRFNSKEDAIEATELVIEIFVDQMPPLTANYWKDVRKHLEQLKEW